MIAVDASVAVAGLLSWHEAHAESRPVLSGAAIPAHALTETFSVMTRLPQPLSPSDAARVLGLAFPADSVLTPSPELQRTLVARCADAGIGGGAVYDAYIGLTAAEHDAELVTRDRRAWTTYERVGATVRLI